MASLIQTYGQPHQLSLQRIAELMEEPTIRSGDTAGFRKFALRVRALVGMLEQLGEDGRIELRCGSHVARLLRKLPQDLRATFRRYLYSRRDGVPSLMDFAEWLEYELVIQEGGDRLDRIGDAQGEKGKPKEGDKSKRAARKTTTVLHGAAQDTAPHAGPAEVSAPQEALDKPKAYCPYCSNTQHFLDQCLNFKQLTKEQKATWVKSNNRCWRCGRHHQAAQCRLKVLCKTSKREVAAGAEVKSSTDVLYLDRRAGCNQVLLKVSKVLLRNGEHTLETYAILDDGSERTILLQDAAERLQLQGTPESLILRTVREDRRELHGSSVTFKISPASQPTKTFTVTNAFTAAAVKTRLGWTLQGPVKSLQQYSHQQQCLFLATTSQAAELFKQVEKLWQLDTLPYRSERLVTRSRRDQEATNLLGEDHESGEKRLSRDPVKAEAYRAEIMKLRRQVMPPEEHSTAISSDIKGMFHQRHVHDHSHQGDEVCESIERHFYVDNWLQSFSSPDGAKEVIDKLRGLLMEGGFELRQWASNIPDVISHLPNEIRSEGSEQWLNHTDMDPQEAALGLRWLCHSDTLRYKSRLLKCSPPTMRNIYRVLASQYDPIGFLTPFTTRAKVLVQQLWDKKREWDDPLLPGDLLTAWKAWEDELPHLDDIRLPRCYVSLALDHAAKDAAGHVEVAFLTARSRMAPKRQLSIPRLELCAALTGAQLANLLIRELTLEVSRVVMWTDSTTVLAWIQSDSCRFKVFVGTRIAEIQELTDSQAWRYVETSENPADDLTRGKTLQDLIGENRWTQGPPFLWLPPDQWPTHPIAEGEDVAEELRRPTTCLMATVTTNHPLPDAQQFSSFSELVKATARHLHGAAADEEETPTAEKFKEAELSILRSAQRDSFPEEVRCLAAGKPVPSSSCLITLAPEYDVSLRLIRVGGRLRRCQELEPDVIHPVVLDPRHVVTKLLIRQVDSDLKHPGAERLFAELRRKFWILHGREAIRREQRSCPECQRWRAQPVNPKMADLPPARLRLYRATVFSTGIDCFGPLQVKVGRRSEKRWGLLFKCLTTRAVHIEVLSSINTDSFLMALRRFISRRGKPAELLSDQGTNFRGGNRELQEAFRDMHPSLQAELAEHQIKFCFNPPGAPHFGGSWEQEIRSIKTALTATMGSQVVSGEVLTTT
ncbi:hypothetical protein AAFF_G00361240 [Aldrovandia affinis]|uniref:Integrase catalytic domain-containing protein n=1 Tax=Aldrovandia affinis TaxID=143900 RepID=A0AAD7R5J1_9TELE|nr:hypothetical protein AAFF_G00361240 [Aldrovandia affinis]